MHIKLRFEHKNINIDIKIILWLLQYYLSFTKKSFPDVKTTENKNDNLKIFSNRDIK